ncbi:peptidoglycan-binding protein [Halalkalibacillus halophilus]|uniref:peptidoglycan-binding protein n=1 Tax=Halalkalibacillus halophilus TaxID=392827 RepID=UPI00040BA558|nr:peptidoglycan-binding protein [Halalkalibacillus halophilus]
MSNHQEFLNSIKEDILKLWDDHSILPSVAAGQAVHETGGGTSEIAEEARNLFGIKANGVCEGSDREPVSVDDPDWDGDAGCYLTWEEVDGEPVEVYDVFREYDSRAESINNYGEFLNADDRYADVIGETDPEAALAALADAGYATDSNYFDSVLSAIETYSLTEWDDEVLNNNGGNEGKIAIGAGHGGSGSTDGKRTPDGEYEWDFNNEVVLAAIDVFEASGYEVLRLDDETGQEDVPLATRTSRANDWGADIYISVHHNALGTVWRDERGGVETFTQEGSYPESESLAEAVHPLYVEAMGLHDRGLKKSNLHITRETNMPAILTEGGFMDSLQDIEVMRDDEKLRQQGEAIAQGAIDFLGGASTDPEPDPDPEPEPDPDPEPTGDNVEDVQQWLNNTYSTGLDVDNIYGPLTNEALVIGVQTELNEQFNAGLSVDGIFGPATQSAFVNVRRGAEGNLTRLIQGQLIGQGYDPNGFDGIFGPGLEATVEQFQSDQGLSVDGVVGANTASALFGDNDDGDNGGGSPDSVMEEIQQFLNNTYSTGLNVDGLYGPMTKEGIVIGVQTELNEQFGASLSVDGIFGPATQDAFVNITPGAEGNITRLIQAQLIGIGYDPNGFDGIFGSGLESAVRDFQSNNGLSVDGIVGPATANALFNAG